MNEKLCDSTEIVTWLFVLWLNKKLPHCVVMYTVGQSINHCPLLVSGAAQFSRFPLPAGQPVCRCVSPPRSPGSGQEVTDFQSSNGRHRNNKSSIHRHLAFVFCIIRVCSMLLSCEIYFLLRFKTS